MEIRQLVEAVLLLVEGIWELLGSCRDGIEFEERLSPNPLTLPPNTAIFDTLTHIVDIDPEEYA